MDDTCIADGCRKPVQIKARRLCRGCYQRAWKAGELTDAVQMGRVPENRKCSRENCTAKHHAEGLCRRHLNEARRDGILPANECKFEGCTRVMHIQATGLCLTHYRQQKAGKQLTPIEGRQKRTGHCNGPECTDPVQAKGYCSSHYWQFLTDKPLTPIKRITDDQRGTPCQICVKHQASAPVRTSYTSDGLCRTHSRWRAEGRPYDGPIPPKAADGEGHIDANGYRLIQHEGRQRLEHRVMAEQALGRPLAANEDVHHRNGNRSDNRIKGPFTLNSRGHLVSGNLEIWSTKQPAGQEIGPKLEWAVELLEEYAEFLPREHEVRLRKVLDGRALAHMKEDQAWRPRHPWPTRREEAAGDGR